MELEDKAKVVAPDWGTKFVQFLAARLLNIEKTGSILNFKSPKVANVFEKSEKFVKSFFFVCEYECQPKSAQFLSLCKIRKSRDFVLLNNSCFSLIPNPSSTRGCLLLQHNNNNT